jgi:hypothetical protein
MPSSARRAKAAEFLIFVDILSDIDGQLNDPAKQAISRLKYPPDTLRRRPNLLTHPLPHLVGTQFETIHSLLNSCPTFHFATAAS